MKIIKVLLAVGLISSSLIAQTVVEVNGHAIDERELIPMVQKIARGQYAELPQDKKQLVQKMAVDQAITMVLLKEEAERSDIKKTDAYKKAFTAYVKNVVEPKIVYQTWVERELGKIKVSDKEIVKFYKENKERLNQPKMSHVHHILLKTKKEAAAVIAKIKKSKDIKATFLKMASEKMGTPETGASDLGALHDKSNMAPAFKAAYAKMKANTLSSKPVKTQFGFHVIYVDEVQGGQKKTLDELRPFIKKAVRGQKFEEILKVRVTKLREKAKIEFK